MKPVRKFKPVRRLVLNTSTAESGINLNQFQSFSFILNKKDLIRRDRMEDRDFLVVPMVMMKEGILNGSQGPLYYPSDEMAKLPAVWNHKPVVVYHPTMNGVGISACDPMVISNRKVGVIMNTRFDVKDSALKAEAWLEESRLKKIDNRILENIEKGQMTEISTGLFTDNDTTEGEFNGKPYKGIARNYRPDHLAILPDIKGACSIEDGAGLLRNERSFDAIRDELNKQIQKKPLTDGAMSSTRWVHEVFPKFFIYDEKGKLFHQEYSVDGDKVITKGMPKEVTEKKQYISKDGKVIANARGEGQSVGWPKQGDGGTDTCVCPKCGAKIKHIRGTPCTESTCPKCGAKMIGNSIVHNKIMKEDGRFAVFTEDGDRRISMWYKTKDEAKKRLAQIEHFKNMKQNQRSSVRKPILNKERKMDKDTMIDALIENGLFVEEDREFLQNKTDEQVGKLHQNAFPPKKEEEEEEEDMEEEEEPKGKKPAFLFKKKAPTKNQEQMETPAEPMTTEQYIANAPGAVQEVLVAGLNSYNAEKSRLIAEITANKANVFPKESLAQKSLGDLQGIAALAKSTAKAATPPATTMNFAGQAPVVIETTTNAEEPLVAPSMDFSAKK